MYYKADKLIKVASKVIAMTGIGLSVITGFSMMRFAHTTEAEFSVGFAYFLLVPLSVLVVAILMYGFGDLVGSLAETARYTAKIHDIMEHDTLEYDTPE